MNSPRKEDLPVAALAACVLSLVTGPFLYVAIDIFIRSPFTSFPPEFYVTLLPILIVCAGFLFWRLLARPVERPRRISLLIVHGICWYVVVTVLVYVSAANLQVGFERIGFSSVLFLLAWLAWLPVTVLRKTTLEQRLARLPYAAVVGILVVILAASGLASISYFVTPAKFI